MCRVKFKFPKRNGRVFDESIGMDGIHTIYHK